jgi:anti-anti-sigma factor
MSNLHLHVSRVGDADVLAVRGPMVAAQAMTLHAALEGLLQNRGAVIVVDLGEARPCDLTALTVLRAAAAVAVTGGGAVRLAAPSAEAQAVLEAARAAKYLPTFPSVADAVSA